MVNTGRVLEETRRHLLRRSTGWILAGYLLGSGLAALYASQGNGLEIFTAITYVFLPLGLCPIAAHRVLRDPEHGMSELAASTPLSQAERILGRTLALVGLLTAGLLATVPVLYAATSVAPSGAFSLLSIYLAWGASLGLAAGAAGVLIGVLILDRPRLGLAFSFLLVLVWLALASAPLLVEPAQGLRRGLLAWVPTAWFAWAGARGPLFHPGTIHLLLGPVALAVGLAGLATVVELNLQTAAGWRPLGGGSGPPLAIALGVLVLVPLAGVGLDKPAYVSPKERSTDPPRFDNGSLVIEPTLRQHTDTWADPLRYSLHLDIAGPPNATLEVTEFRIKSPTMTFQPTDPIPDRIVLDNVHADTFDKLSEDNGTIGTADVVVDLEATPTRMTRIANGTIVIGLDDRHHPFPFSAFAGPWELPLASTLASSVAMGGGLAVAARWLPPRWNRW